MIAIEIAFWIQIIYFFITDILSYLECKKVLPCLLVAIKIGMAILVQDQTKSYILLVTPHDNDN